MESSTDEIIVEVLNEYGSGDELLYLHTTYFQNWTPIWTVTAFYTDCAFEVSSIKGLN